MASFLFSRHFPDGKDNAGEREFLVLCTTRYTGQRVWNESTGSGNQAIHALQGQSAEDFGRDITMESRSLSAMRILVEQQLSESDVQLYEKKEGLLERGTAGHSPNRDKQGNSGMKFHVLIGSDSPGERNSDIEDIQLDNFDSQSNTNPGVNRNWEMAGP